MESLLSRRVSQFMEESDEYRASLSREDLLQPSHADHKRVTAWLFVIVGIVALGVIIRVVQGGTELHWTIGFLPALAIGAGALTGTTDWGTEVDPDSGRISCWRRFGGSRTERETSLESVDAVRVTVHDRGRSNGSYRMYVLELVGVDLKEPVWMGEELFGEHAAVRAKALGELLARPVRGVDK
jgi:hypothetical protein